MMFYNLFCDAHVACIWCSRSIHVMFYIFCDVYAVYTWCSTYFRIFIWCMFQDYLCVPMRCSTIYFRLFKEYPCDNLLNFPQLCGFVLSLVICSMLFVIFQCMLCYLFIYLFSIYFIGFILIFIPIALTYNLFSRSRILFL